MLLVVGAGKTDVVGEDDVTQDVLIAVNSIVGEEHFDFVFGFVFGGDFDSDVFESVDEFFPVGGGFFQEGVSDFINLNEVGKGGKVSIVSRGRITRHHQATKGPDDGLIGISLLFFPVGDRLNISLNGLADFLLKSHAFNNFFALLVIPCVCIILGEG
jgi:hypothetical protein